MANNNEEKEFDGKAIEKIMNEAIKLAIEKQLKLGVPAVYMKEGKICYLMPDGREIYKEDVEQKK